MFMKLDNGKVRWRVCVAVCVAVCAWLCVCVLLACVLCACCGTAGTPARRLSG
jgi:hypothetical protein